MTDIAQHRSTFRLGEVPIPIFAIGMGVLGLGLCWRYAGLLIGAPRMPADIMLLGGIILSAAALAIQAIRLFRAPGGLADEVRHPVRGPLIAQPIVVILLIAEATAHDFSLLSEGLLSVGAILSLGVTLWVLARHIGRLIDMSAISPTWLVAPIAIEIAAILFASEHRHALASALLGCAVITHLVLMPAVLLRLILTGPLPPPAQPLVVILTAPLPLLFIAYVQIVGLDLVAWGIIGASFLVAGVVLATIRRWRRAPFGLPWWALGMPPAAVVLAVITLAEKIQAPSVTGFALVLVVAQSIVTGWLLVRTAMAAARGELF
ncbi:hypothetical protein [Bosea sp. (in: a-proteobacteria)]|uniref:SLAC1 family transporter n=1 Tax=Bosea sp. (in: a-proteobacteria) TaxID=1871050 RepID=UPI002B486EF6|nr:hypothetical protein [Bosea sp. (in: a-proteobacteria)]WRH60133.1 MAG: hypothetical protein RSE11_10315 [Bosea sp. (in: a-proteobacteria)]